ncbi:uncharacterized protein rrp1 isoform 1-T1 [Pholidichthys leucotaenia]
MALVQQAEVQLAQRLASNDRPVRTRTVRKIRKYLSARDRTGGFCNEELLKLWKGLFYCLWMQDKPLLQEELSKQVSSFIHVFTTTDRQLAFFQSFLQTFKREWTGIDRLRLDKFYQLIRFMFQQTFEVLKKKNWDESSVSDFLQLLTVQLLQDGDAPIGLQLHVLDVYLTELAAVGAKELTADQNLTFIEPFCRTAAKTRDRSLFPGICGSIFRTIIDHAPFAIEELMREVQEEEQDSGQESEDGGEKMKVNGGKCNKDHDDLLHLDHLNSDGPVDEDVGPVLQFDYGAVADKLLEFSSGSGTPGENREKLYRIIKVLRDLSEGRFPEDEYPEEVSTDEEDDMFGSRSFIKRGRRGREDESANQTKAKQKKKEDGETADEKKKKKKRKKKKNKMEENGVEGVNKEILGGDRVTEKDEAGPTDQSEEREATQSPTTAETVSPHTSEKKKMKKKKRVMDTVEMSGETKLLLPQESDCSTTEKPEEKSGETTSLLKKKKGGKALAMSVETEMSEEMLTPPTEKNKGKKTEATAMNKVSEETASLSTNKKKKRKTEIKSVEETGSCEDSGETKPLEDDSTTATKKKNNNEETGVNEVSGETAPVSTTTPKTNQSKNSVTEGGGDSQTPAQKTTKKETEKLGDVRQKKKKKHEKDADGGEQTPVKKKKKKKTGQLTNQMESSTGHSEFSKTLKKKRKIPVVFEFEADELQESTKEETTVKKVKVTYDVSESLTPLTVKKQQKKKQKEVKGTDFVKFQSNTKIPTPLFCCSMPRSGKKKTQTPKSDSKKVTFGLKNNRTAEFKKSDRSLLLSPDGSSRIPFDPQQKPKFGVLKSPPTLTPVSKKTKKTGSKKTPNKRQPQASDYF